MMQFCTFYYPHDAMLAHVLAMAPCPSVTSQCIKTDELINLVLPWGLLLTSHAVCFKEIQVFTKTTALPSATFP